MIVLDTDKGPWLALHRIVSVYGLQLDDFVHDQKPVEGPLISVVSSVHALLCENLGVNRWNTVLQELTKMFNDNDSFYYSPTGDLTNSVQRRHEKKADAGDTNSVNTDDRFFWNKPMLQDLINSKVSLDWEGTLKNCAFCVIVAIVHFQLAPFRTGFSFTNAAAEIPCCQSC